MAQRDCTPITLITIVALRSVFNYFRKWSYRCSPDEAQGISVIPEILHISSITAISFLLIAVLLLHHDCRFRQKPSNVGNTIRAMNLRTTDRQLGTVRRRNTSLIQELKEASCLPSNYARTERGGESWWKYSIPRSSRHG